jgi:ribosomal protein S18 acetylase RimI-like enzyme
MEIINIQNISTDLLEKFLAEEAGEKNLFSKLASSQTGNDRTVTRERIEYIRNSDEHIMLLCIEEDALLGMAVCQKVTGINNAYVYFHDLVVDTSYRGKGTGSKLIEELMRLSAEKYPEAVRFQLTSRPSRGTGPFFEKHGFKPRTKESGDETIVYVKNIGDYTS